MISQRRWRNTIAAAIGAAVLLTAGCPGQRRPAAPLGTLSDPVWQNQEANAERSDFVVHEHEFVADTEFLNTAGEDHLKQIAWRLSMGQDAQVIVERSRNTARPETEHKYRVHPSPELDMRRRDIVVRCLMAMRVSDADARTVIAPDIAPLYRSDEISASYWGDAYGGQWGGNGGGGGGGYGGYGLGGGGWGGGWAGNGMGQGAAGIAGEGNGGSVGNVGSNANTYRR